ncbi:transcription factor TFIIIB component B'' homolog Bdp1 [Rhynchophorus ferrugineus]|uniref:transcription factor TFIIIB component B'' homolog Bdp1 n=1 Tax=Rhynchophorus ferrugineus TaxID=354439 RepID=UPI003FCD2006
MTSRRTRIKGIANIPQRKKATPTDDREARKEEANSKGSLDTTQDNRAVSSSSNDTQHDIKTDAIDDSTGSYGEKFNKSNICDNQDINNEQNTIDLKKTTDFPNTGELPSAQANNARRKFLKPAININVATKRRLQDNKNGEMEDSDQLSKKVLVEDGEENITNGHVIEKNHSDMVLNETNLFSTDIPASRTSVVTFSPNIKHIVPDVQSPLDSDYSVPPSSPTKYNRRVKAVPKLKQRKTSFSASESEDESRRNGRIRNNSVCSVASTIGPDPPTPLSDSMNTREGAPVIQKKICRTDQSRKLAEARREFQKKFGTTNPDKQKLKMIDLIFYNPSTNPMSQQANGQILPVTDSNQNESNIEEVVEEEAVDDPTKENNSDNGVPVPQIKIGPSGEIILDEKSLMVENAEVTKQKQKIQNSEVVDGNFDSGYGIYTRAVRSKDWTHKETLRFYKALNLIGTDFTTMSKLFPKRSRRELKLKFNKEERINRQLIDKAIMQPCSYNFSELKREIEIEEAEEAAVQKLKEEELEQRKKNRQSKRGRKRKSLIDAEPGPEPERDQSRTLSLDTEREIVLKPPGPKKLKSLNITSVLQSDSDADVSDLETQSECDDQDVILPALQQTRSGRMPKSIQRYSTEAETSAARKGRLASLSSYPELNSDKLVPGSVVLMSEDNSNDKYKVYMVTPEKTLTALDLSEDVVSNIIKGNEAIDDEIVIHQNQETNITIPATPPPDVQQIQNQTVTETGTYLML